MTFPESNVSDLCQDLIKRLICDKDDRITIPKIKEHELFTGIDFNTIRDTESPIKPTFDTDGDTRNFDSQAIRDVVSFDSLNDSTSEYMNRKYMNFTYVSHQGQFG